MCTRELPTLQLVLGQCILFSLVPCSSCLYLLRFEFFIFTDMVFKYFMIYYAHCLLCLLFFTKEEGQYIL